MTQVNAEIVFRDWVAVEVARWCSGEESWSGFDLWVLVSGWWCNGGGRGDECRNSGRGSGKSEVFFDFVGQWRSYLDLVFGFWILI